MPLHPHRFIHAANLRLDVPVSVQTAEALTDDLRNRFEDATIDAFDYIIDLCRDHEVRYLLLSGNVFIEAERSLRARLALLDGFRRLAEHAIDVVVIPGISDPPEAWRSIPELPSNVSICCSSDPAPVEVRDDETVVATVSASMWYGDADSFGIRVIRRSEDGPEPFRIGTVSESGWAEALRVARMTQEAGGDAGTEISDPLADTVILPEDTATTGGESDDEFADESLSLDVLDESNDASAPGQASSDDSPTLEPVWKAGFVRHCDELFREGCLHYLALMDDLRRSTLQRGSNVVHAPGTTQPRHALEASRGSCSLVDVSADGQLTIREINSSAVDWKQIEIHVDQDMTLSTLLQIMKTRLAGLSCSASDCVWSVQWTLRGPLPVLQSLQEEDLDVAVAVELDVLDVDGEELELLHAIRIVPDAWAADDVDSLAGQFVDHCEQPDLLQPASLQSLLNDNRTLTAGWKKRLASLIPTLDADRIHAQFRTDGAAWFVEDIASLMPEMLDTLTEQPEILDEHNDDDLIDDDSEAGTTTAESEVELREDTDARLTDIADAGEDNDVRLAEATAAEATETDDDDSTED